MRNVFFILGLLWYCTAGKGRNLPFWTALCKYSHKFLYSANKPYNYKRVKDMWGVGV